MALRGVQIVVEFFVWDTTTGKGKTGDAANLTLSWTKDGTRSATTNAPAEVSATEVPGQYKVTITATEAQCDFGTLHGKSATANVEIVPVPIAFERLPNVDPGANGGLALVDAGGRVKADLERWLAAAPNALVSGRLPTRADSQLVASGTFQAGSTTSSLILQNGAGAAWWVENLLIVITSGAAIGQHCGVGALAGPGGATPTVTPKNPTTLATAPANGDTWEVWALPQGADSWDVALPGSYAVGRAGRILGDLTALVDELESRLTATRAAFLDKLNVTGNVASSAEVTAIQNNTRVRVVVPSNLERPDSGSVTYRLWLYLYDAIGNMEAPDATPAITAQNQAGTDRSANLGAVANPSTGVYSVDYTVAAAHAIEGLLFEWTVTEGAVARKHGAATLVVDTTAVDFTSADRAKLDTLHDTRLTAGRATALDNLQYLTGDAYARLGAPAGASIAADVAAVKSDTATALARLGAWAASGANTILGAFRALLSKGATAPSDIGGTFDPATDSTEALEEKAALVKAKTDLIPAGGPAAATDFTALRAAKLDNLDVLLSTRATPAQVNAEILDVLNVDTWPELATLPPETLATLRQMIQLPYQALRLRSTQTATQKKLYKADGVTVLATIPVSDDGATFVHDKAS